MGSRYLPADLVKDHLFYSVLPCQIFVGHVYFLVQKSGKIKAGVFVVPLLLRKALKSPLECKRATKKFSNSHFSAKKERTFSSTFLGGKEDCVIFSK